MSCFYSRADKRDKVDSADQKTKGFDQKSLYYSETLYAGSTEKKDLSICFFCASPFYIGASFHAMTSTAKKKDYRTCCSGMMFILLMEKKHAPPGMTRTLKKSWDKLPTSTGAGFLPSTI